MFLLHSKHITPNFDANSFLLNPQKQCQQNAELFSIKEGATERKHTAERSRRHKQLQQ